MVATITQLFHGLLRGFCCLTLVCNGLGDTHTTHRLSCVEAATPASAAQRACGHIHTPIDSRPAFALLLIPQRIASKPAMTESTGTASYPPKSKGRTDWTPEKRAALLETVIVAGSKAIDVEKVAADVSGSCVSVGTG